MMNMEHRLAQTQSQRLMLTQKMQQAIQILQLSMLELDQYVQQELEANPVLEQREKEPEPEKDRPAETPTAENEKQQDDVAFDLDQFSEKWSDYGKMGRDLSRNPDADERRDYYENSITREESLTAHLLTQLRLATTNERELEVGEMIIGEIDARGYFTGSLEVIAEAVGVPVQRANRVLYMIQRFEPTGVGARDLVECLLLQINVEYPEEEQLKTLVSEHLEDLKRRQIPKIAKAMKVTPERVEDLVSMIKKLSLRPGNEYSSEPTQYVTPDVIVEMNEEKGDYDVYLTNDYVPELRISGRYQRLAKKKDLTKDEKQFLRDKLESARWLIRNIEQRQQTILRIAKAIVSVQRDFFDKGIEHIKPLTLQEIADEVGVHEATVSRTTRGKYMQTPQGLFEMKYFFSPGLKKDDGEEQSSKSVQSLIKKIIEEEDKRKPLSDQKIANQLKDEGIQIARRTVTKYREGMGILPTTMRRQYQEA